MYKKLQTLFLFLSVSLMPNILWAQIAGAPEGANILKQLNNTGLMQSNNNRFIAANQQSVDSFETTIFTYADIVIFSYFDDTIIKIYDGSRNLLEIDTLIADTYHRSTYSGGVYHIVGSKSFTVLIGDPITNYVNGYFAVDQAGRGVSTKLNTWMMNTYGYSSDFIIFGYEDNTGFTVRNLGTGALIAAGTLNEGEHYSFANSGSIPVNTPLQVTGTKPVSALSYSDQDYYIPSANGYFTGNLFYGYSGIVGGWANSITVVSYSDNNDVVVTRSSTGDTLETYTLMAGQVHAYNVNDTTWWKVESSGKVAVANIPYGVWSGGYAYMARSIDETGIGAGKLFYVPTCQSEIHVFSFEQNNPVKITRLGTYDTYPYPSPTVIYEDTLEAGEFYSFTSDYGSYVYKIESAGNVSAVQSNYGFGADFMPLSFALQLPDLTLSTSDIEFSIPDSVYVPGDLLSVTATIHNVGSIDAFNVYVEAYDGDPDIGGVAPIIAARYIPFIGAGNVEVFKFDYTVPNNPEFRSIVIKVDPLNNITESNKSNNKAQRFLRPNKDLLPPLSINVTAIANLSIDTLTHELIPNPFVVRYDIFNTGNVTATDVQVNLELFNGLTLSSNNPLINIGNIAAYGNAFVEYEVLANKDSSGFNLYRATITASNAETKTVYRAVNVPDLIPPAAPQNLNVILDSEKCVILSWQANTENDLAGYYVYYSSDSTWWNGENSPLIVYGNNSVALCDLPLLNSENTKYWFMVRAFDTSRNFSEESKTNTVIVTDVNETNEIPEQYALSQNYPNPFNPTSVIKYSIPTSSNVKLAIYNSIGEIVETLVNQQQSAGVYEINWTAKDAASGIYFYVLEAASNDGKNNVREIKKMVLLK